MDTGANDTGTDATTGEDTEGTDTDAGDDSGGIDTTDGDTGGTDTGSGPSLDLLALAVTADEYATSPAPDTYGGAGNGIVDTGETFTLTPTLRNSGATNLSNLTIELRSLTPAATVETSTISLASLAAGADTLFDAGFVVTLSPDIADSTQVDLEIGVQGTSLAIPVKLYPRAVRLTLGNVEFSDPGGNDNGIPDPGEVGVLSFEVANAGTVALPLSAIAADSTGVSYGDQEIDAAVAGLDTVAIVTGAFSPVDAVIAPGGMLATPLTFGLAINAGAAAGDDMCVSIAVDVTVDSSPIYSFATEYCTRVAWGDEDFCNDFDGDDYGTGSLCLGPDCDDSSGTVNPDADELCNLKDDDCDGTVDEDAAVVFYADDDEDGFGAGEGAVYCLGSEPEGVVDNDEDCDDGNEERYPGAAELCDEIDNDCDEAVDESDVTWYRDEDEDGYGVESETYIGCDPPGDDWATEAGDCSPLVDFIYPTAPELCDTADNNCNEAVDEGFDFETDEDNCGGCGIACGDGQRCESRTCVNFCADIDEDGFFGEGTCARANEDCNDLNEDINPGEVDVCGDSIDQDCSGRDAVCPDPCDPFNPLCGPGARCTLNEVPTWVCNEQGETPIDGACTGQGTSDDCVGGSICLDWEVPGSATCHQLCEFDRDCPGDDRWCGLNLTGSAGESLTSICIVGPQCDALAQNCGSGDACIVRDDGSGDPTSERCVTAGTLGDQQACGVTGNCQAGYQCANLGSGALCHRICNPALGDGQCLGGQSCFGIIDWPTDTGLCAVP